MLKNMRATKDRPIATPLSNTVGHDFEMSSCKDTINNTNYKTHERLMNKRPQMFDKNNNIESTESITGLIDWKDAATSEKVGEKEDVNYDEQRKRRELVSGKQNNAPDPDEYLSMGDVSGQNAQTAKPADSVSRGSEPFESAINVDMRNLHKKIALTQCQASTTIDHQTNPVI